MKPPVVRALFWTPLTIGIVIFVSQFFVERAIPVMLGVSCEDQYGYYDDEYRRPSSYNQRAVADCIGEVHYTLRGFPLPFSECTERETNDAGKCEPHDDAALIILWNAAVLIVPGLLIGSVYEGVRQYRKNHRRQSTG